MLVNQVFILLYLAFIGGVIVTGIIKRYWYWLDDNKMPPNNPILEGIDDTFSGRYNHTVSGDYVKAPYEGSLIFTIICFLLGGCWGITWLVILFPIPIFSIIACLSISFGLRWVLRLNKKVEHLET